jgi:AAA15 family ATPase/GTPase
MSIKSIEIKNLLSFEFMQINEVENINCIVGKNNVGKSNLLKVIRFFYGKMAEKRELPPELYSNYDSFGYIKLEFDTELIHRIVRNRESTYFEKISNILFNESNKKTAASVFSIPRMSTQNKGKPTERKLITSYFLTLFIHSNGAVEWSVKDREVIKMLLYLFPFFEVDSRYMDLHEWDKIWHLISRLKSFDTKKIKNEDILKFFDDKLNDKSSSRKSEDYSKFIRKIDKTTDTQNYNYKDKVLSYIKVGLKGHDFISDGEQLAIQSDGTNAFYFIDTLLTLLVSLTRNEYISPFLFIDEPEIGLHPKRCELLINRLSNSILRHNTMSNGKTRTRPLPKVFFLTHSSNLVKEVVKKFQGQHQVLHISKDKDDASKIVQLKSNYDKESRNFLSIFSDNEARLFFSEFIFFVEGETEQEAFGNLNLTKHFDQLNNIDIYKCSNNILSEEINPSRTKASIPYLFLYDADKAYELKKFTANTASIKLKKTSSLVNFNINRIQEELKYFKKGYSQKHREQCKELSHIHQFSLQPTLIDRASLTCGDLQSYTFFQKSIQKYLMSKRVKLVKTTFEGCLICIESADLFYAWLKETYNVDLYTMVKHSRKKTVDNEKRLIDFIRIIFNGKSDTLLSRKQIGRNKSLYMSTLAQEHLHDITKKCKFSRGKTDGWVTLFINYSIIQIEKEVLTKNRSFQNLFNSYFPEFHGIICELQPDRYRELRK